MQFISFAGLVLGSGIALTKYEKSAEQEGTHATEIVLGLHSPESQSKENAHSDDQGLKHDDLIIKSNDETDGERFAKRESRQQEKIEGVRMAFPPQETECDERAKHGGVESPKTRKYHASIIGPFEIV